mmetsp:Transcript_8656/g.27240  ORF Transcript_8656/g.27240 Transcript_8656/m.27240 type:complete len:103 (-) Transcript_8656:1650-1958(-)
MVDRRCATMMVVRFRASCRSDSMMLVSVCESRDEVASSQRRMGALRSMARAMATRCFSPPDSFKPRSPTRVSYPLGMFMIASCSLAARAASITCSLVADRSP